MQKKTIFLIAFLEQDNLGIGYIASVLLENQYDVKIIDFRLGRKIILKELLLYTPPLVGFSIIFQYHIYEFDALIRYLRTNGIKSHFCAGGHYPSLRYSELLQMIPELNSVVLYEGEYTFRDLAEAIIKKNDWEKVKGIAYRQNGSLMVNDLRPLEKNLDNFPVPVRQPLKEYAFGKKYATLLASRGCFYNCSFCSIRQFYSKPPGPIKRIRRPEMVVKEMELLYRELDCSIFMFQDDDFPASSLKEERWIRQFCETLSTTELNGNLLWKINCRPDEVELDLFRMMKEAGLFLVYLGIEDGTDIGLELMNKRITKETNLHAVNLLKELEISFDFGFMLFNPKSTFQTISENIDFLEKICADGSSPVTFCKMLPYAETSIEKLLKQKKRLKGAPGFEDYEFLQPGLNLLYSFSNNCFDEWMGSHDGILNIARWARYHLSVIKKFYGEAREIQKLEEKVKTCIAESNRFFIQTYKKLLQIFYEAPNEPETSTLKAIKDEVGHSHEQYRTHLMSYIKQMEQLIN